MRPEGYLVGDFESVFLQALNSKWIFIYVTLRVIKTFLHLSLHVHLFLRLEFLRTPLRVSRLSLTPPLPLTSLGELKESKGYKSDTSMHDHGCHEWYGCNVDEEEFGVEETFLGD